MKNYVFNAPVFLETVKQKSRKTTICTLYVYSRFFYFVKLLNLPALPTILLAGHFCIFNKLNRVEELPHSVFEKISLERILLLEADPEQILTNLSVRDKKKYEYRQIERLIREERRVAEEISQKCNCDLHIHQMTFDNSDLKKCCNLLSAEVQTV